MKTTLKKFQIILLTILIVLGIQSIISANEFKNVTNNKYVLSSYFPRQNLHHPLQIQQAKNIVNTTNLPANTEKSSNWSGYVDSPSSQSTSYTSVSGSWTIPSISVNKQNAMAAQWIGLGGVKSTDLLQMGTIEEIQNGQAVAEVFWERLPDAAQNVLSAPINSTINVSISKPSNSTWNLTFTVTTPNGQTQTKTISTTLDSSYAQGIGTSAEWISEDPSNGNNKLYPLANMGTIKYTSAAVNGALLNASSNSVSPVAMESSNGSIAIYPSTIGTDGKSFTTTSTNTNSTTTDVNPNRININPARININPNRSQGFNNFQRRSIRDSRSQFRIIIPY